MAAPDVLARASGVNSTNSSAHPITLPAGIVAGDFLLCVFSCDGYAVITQTVGDNWTKLGQLSHTTAVTSAVFWKIAVGGDTLTLNTMQTAVPPVTVNEQSSHVTFRIRPAQVVEGSSITGSVANTDPPGLGPTWGVGDYLWIATRHGDAAVVATAAPSGFTNLQTAAGGDQGASTNTAELRESGVSSRNPGPFTSATEDWLSWTLAVFERTAVREFAAAYAALSAVSNTLTAGYTVMTTEVGGAAWFARITDGYDSWAPYGQTALAVSNEWSALYLALNAVETVFTVGFRVGEQVTGYEDSWFPLLTQGANTWAGETSAPTTGSIDGAVEFPLFAVTTYAAGYNAATEVANTRAALYNINQLVAQTYDATYDLSGRVSQLYLAEYQIRLAAQNELAAGYEVFGIIGSVSQTFAVAYNSLAPVSRAFSALYEAFDSGPVDNTFGAEFNVLTLAQQTRDVSYAVHSAVSTTFDVSYVAVVPVAVAASLTVEYVTLAPVSVTFAPEWGVFGVVQQTFAAGWDTTSPVEQAFAAGYDLGGFAEQELDAIYQAAEPVVSGLDVLYAVAIVEHAEHEVDVYRYGQVEVHR